MPFILGKYKNKKVRGNSYFFYVTCTSWHDVTWKLLSLYGAQIHFGTKRVGNQWLVQCPTNSSWPSQGYNAVAWLAGIRVFYLCFICRACVDVVASDLM
eukprot:scaffold193712_cov13-Tisochrysis_lutea.AAC.1